MQQKATLASEVKRRFGHLIQDLIIPGSSERDRTGQPIPNATMREFAQVGLFACSLPKEVGGEQLDMLSWGSMLEQIGYLCDELSFPFLVSLRTSVAATLILPNRPDLLDEYVKPMMRGERFGSFAYTENADAFSFKTFARYSPNRGYVLNGEKCFIGGGATADSFLVFTRVESDDIMVFLVERTDPGVELIPLSMHGLRSFGLCALRLNNVKLGSSRLIFPADGLKVAQQFLNQRRVLLVCALLGRMRSIIEICVNYLQQTIRYDSPLAEMKNVQSTLGRMFVSLETAKSIVYRALERLVANQHDPLWDPIISSAKYVATEQANQLALLAFKLTGGRGCMEETGIGRYQRDVTGFLAGADPQETLQVNLGVHLIHEYECALARQTEQKNEI